MNDLAFSLNADDAPTGEPRTNQYRGTCLKCGASVDPRQGYVFKSAGGAWRTCCKSKLCYATVFGADAAAEVGRRYMEVDGTLHGVSDVGSRALVKAIANWNPERRVWVALGGRGDRELVLEVLARLEVEVPSSWVDEQVPAPIRALVQVAAENGARAYQSSGIAWLAQHETACLADDMGLGKQQPVDALVMTPTGWRRIGSLAVGDFVTGSDGKPTRVRGVFPQGVQPSYRVRFSDGSSAEAGPEHLWSFTYMKGGKKPSPLTLTTDQLRTGATIEQRDANGRASYLNLSKTPLKLPMLSAPIDFPEADLPVSPYTLGALIANGGLSNRSAKLTVGAVDWPEVHARLLAEGADIRSVRQYVPTVIATNLCGVHPAIRGLGLAVKSGEKFIPRAYLHASPSQRVALLHGLMDGDGSCSATRNKLSYHTTSGQLADDVRELVEGLGGIASVRRYDRSHHDKPTDYAVRIRLPKTIAPFSVSRKLERYNPGNRAHPVRTFVSAEYVRDVESVCISVEAEDQLYVTERCILTHNTFQILHALPEGEGLVVVCPAVVKGVWVQEIKKWCPSRFDSVHVCTGRGSFRWPAHPRECVIINFDILPPLASEKKKHPACGKPPCPVTLVADEAHALKNNKALRTQRFRAMAKHCAHVWGATGTPVEAKPQELWGVLTSLRCNPLSWTAFCDGFNAYQGKYGLEFRRDADGAIIVNPGVSERLRRTMLRRVKSEVAAELPPKIYSEHPVAITAKLVKRLDEIAETWIDYLLADELPPFEAMAAVRRVLAEACIPTAQKLADEYEEQGTPAVFFSAHRAPVEALAKRKGWGCIIGGMPADERTRTVEAFQAGKLRGIACTIRAAGVGITLTRASSMVFVDLDWSPSANTQAEDRCHRIGQDAQSVDITRLVPDHVLTRHIGALLHAKSVFVQRTLHSAAGYDSSGAEGLDAEDVDAWRERVSAHQSERERTADERRRRELSRLASGSKTLTPAQAEERADLRLKSRGTTKLELTPEFVGIVQDAFAYMLGVCDGARERDDVGFNAPDAAISRWVAPAVAAGSPAGLTCAYTLLRHYPRQLSARWGELFDA